MFTGIIQSVAQVLAVKALGEEGKGLVITTDLPQLQDAHIGDSIAINGVCLTIVQKDKCAQKTVISFDVSAHTVRTTNLGALVASQPTKNTYVNIETSLRVGESLDGHIVYGHVDCVGSVMGYEQLAESRLLVVHVPNDYAHLVCARGSIAINGISLTIAELQETQEAVALTMVVIPHTHQHTLLQYCTKGDKVNMEFDMLARYVARQHALGIDS